MDAERVVRRRFLSASDLLLIRRRAKLDLAPMTVPPPRQERWAVEQSYVLLTSRNSRIAATVIEIRRCPNRTAHYHDLVEV
jgi:hypothetical protein